MVSPERPPKVISHLQPKNLETMDNQPKEDFDCLTRLMQVIFQVPIAIIGLLSNNRLWFKSIQGISQQKINQEYSFYTHTIQHNDLLYIPNTLEHSDYKEHPLVTNSPYIKMYAGFPFTVPNEGYTGVLAIMNQEPHVLTQNQLDLFINFALFIASELNCHKFHSTETDVRRYAIALESLPDVANSKSSLQDTINQYLDIGRKVFQLPLGIVSHIEGDTYTVKYVVGPENAPTPGTKLPFANTYCHQTFMSEQPKGFHHVNQSILNNHPCYKEFGLEAYIGACLFVNGERYGTLNFSSPHPHQNTFTSSDYCFIQLFSQWIGNEIARAQTSQDLIKAKEEAEQHNIAKTEFINTVSHELRTPLTVITGYLPLLLDANKLPAPDVISAMSQDMKASADHLLELINELLDISKIEAGKMELNFAPVDISNLINEVISSLKFNSEKKGLAINNLAKPDIIQIDPVRIKQVLYNLVGNAIKFTNQGSITLTTETSPKNITIKVIDTGIGISEQNLTHIFEKFKQADSSSTRLVGGTGLGLTIAKLIVELHQGEIFVTSQLGAGSTFTITLPYEEG